MKEKEKYKYGMLVEKGNIFSWFELGVREENVHPKCPICKKEMRVMTNIYVYDFYCQNTKCTAFGKFVDSFNKSIKGWLIIK